MDFDVPEGACKVCKRKRKPYSGAGVLEPFHLAVDSHKRAHFYYGIRISTGSDKVLAMAHKDAYVSIIGSKACTGKFTIVHKWLGTAPSPHYYDDIMIESTKALGEVLVVNLCTSKHWTFEARSAWLVNFVERENQLERQRTRYKWQHLADVAKPSGIDIGVTKLPSDEQFESTKQFSLLQRVLESKGALMTKTAFSAQHSLSNYEELARCLRTADIPIYARWTKDAEFGRQVLNGVNSVVIKKCTSLPENFPLQASSAEESLVRGLSLQDEMKSSPPLPSSSSRHHAGMDNPIFYPSDTWIDWTIAKLYFQSANTQFHQVVTHYLSCHVAMEAYCIGTMRNLPDSHPVHKLLKPHFQYTMAINEKTREELYNDGGIMDKALAIGGEGQRELMRRGWRAFDIRWTHIKHSVHERGVDSPEMLPGYYYRDDGLKIWQAIEAFVSAIISEFYISDDDVKDDPELLSWAGDINANGFSGHQGASQGHGFPKTIESREQLVDLCTLIIFTGSAHHASTNSGQYDVSSFCPNAPTYLRLPSPTVKGKADTQTLLDTLPDRDGATASVALSHVLSQFSNDELHLGDFPDARFTEKKVQNMISQFRSALCIIEKQIKERNAEIETPYIYLLPSRIPNSISI
eukprot:Em0005g961a